MRRTVLDKLEDLRDLIVTVSSAVHSEDPGNSAANLLYFTGNSKVDELMEEIREMLKGRKR